MADTPRLEALRRRVELDPASIAFAQLAEEHRRAGELEEAVRVARAGLEVHPSYVSARVTLARALAELGQLEDAKAEFGRVLLAAPDNLLALRGMAELHQRLEAPPGEDPIAPTGGDPPLTDVDLAPAQIDLQILESWLAAIVADRAERQA